ncbi:MAG: hypothetical protein IPF51_16355 [Dehalococcoidia bacterium]|uniref:hypothetical protein n=1 Tax=Candidatus Amarobacter glycogenicus TaxID=3140699 RepID=UPI0031367CDC|nr:hypothetical protein [Dehalococcoidia bacterium]
MRAVELIVELQGGIFLQRANVGRLHYSFAIDDTELALVELGKLTFAPNRAVVIRLYFQPLDGAGLKDAERGKTVFISLLF